MDSEAFYWNYSSQEAQWRNSGLKSGGPSSMCTYKVGVSPPLQKLGTVSPSPRSYAYAYGAPPSHEISSWVINEWSKLP